MALCSASRYAPRAPPDHKRGYFTTARSLLLTHRSFISITFPYSLHPSFSHSFFFFLSLIFRTSRFSLLTHRRRPRSLNKETKNLSIAYSCLRLALCPSLRSFSGFSLVLSASIFTLNRTGLSAGPSVVFPNNFWHRRKSQFFIRTMVAKIFVQNCKTTLKSKVRRFRSMDANVSRHEPHEFAYVLSGLSSSCCEKNITE